MNKRLSRLRRATKARALIKRKKALRLSVHRSLRHISAQVIDDATGSVKAAASSMEKDFNGKAMGNVEGAKVIGKLLAERAAQAGVKAVAFDRSGFYYHGRVKALADAAREAGMEF